jgi:hypothetical protein
MSKNIYLVTPSSQSNECVRVNAVVCETTYFTAIIRIQEKYPIGLQAHHMNIVKIANALKGCPIGILISSI